MNKKLFHVQVITVMLTTFFLFGFVPQVVWAAEVQEDFNHKSSSSVDKYDLDSIYIFYDYYNQTMLNIAQAVYKITSHKIDGLKLVPIRYFSDFKYWLSDEPWIAVYALQSNLSHVIYDDIAISWDGFYNILRYHRQTQHIVGMGNTLSLDQVIDEDCTNIVHSDTEQTDAFVLVVYDLWAIADAIGKRGSGEQKYQNAAEAIRNYALKIYTENFGELFSRTIEPVDNVGQINEAELNKRTEDMWDRHEPTIRPATYRMLENGQLEELQDNEIPDDFAPIIQLESAHELADNGENFVLGELPLLSGLRGPIGEIVNVLLSVLCDTENTQITLNAEVMENIRDLFEAIEPFIGLVANYDIDSPMKSIIEAVANEFPFIEEYKPYLEVLLKCLFNLRGDATSIIGVITEAVISLLPEVFPTEIQEFIVDILGVNDDLGTLITGIVNEGKGIFNALLGLFVGQVLSSISNKTLIASLGVNNPEASVLLPRITAFINSVVEYLASWDFDGLIQSICQDLLIDSLDVLSQDDNEFMNSMMTIIRLANTIVDFIDSLTADSIIEVLSDLIATVIGESNISSTTESLARDLMDVVKTYAEGEGPEFSDINAFQTQIDDIINSALIGPVSEDLILAMVDTMTLVAGFYNDDFDDADVSSIFDIVTTLANEYIAPGNLSDVLDAIDGIVKPTIGIMASITDVDALKIMVSQTLDEFKIEIEPIPALIIDIIHNLDLENVLGAISDADDIISILAEIIVGCAKIVESDNGASFEGVIHGLLIATGSVVGSHPAFDDVPIDALLKLLQTFFPERFGIQPKDRPRPIEVIAEIIELAEDNLGTGFDLDMLNEFLQKIMQMKDLFTGGVRWLVGLLFDWLNGELTPLLEELKTSISEILGGADELLGFHERIPIGLGEWNLFVLSIDLGITANFDIDPTPLFDMVASLIFDGREIFSLDTLEDFFGVIFKCLSITPQFYAELGVDGFDSSKNPILGAILESYGFELSFSGSAHFILNLFTFRGGIFEWNDFMRIVEWGFNIKIGISRVFTLLDFITGGTGGSLVEIADYIGLDAITLTVFLAVELDICKKAATSTHPEVSTLTLILSIGAALHIGIDVVLTFPPFHVNLAFDGCLEILLTFFQDLSGSTPLKITLELFMNLKFTVKLLLVSESFEYEILNEFYDISPSPGESEYEDSGIGFDTDGDGLGDHYEASLPGFNPLSPDTDLDGASDKLEVQVMGTDGTVPDTDEDGLLDGVEWALGTNPRQPDTDWDGLSDFDEVQIYGTSPLTQDTDGDGLTDEYEVFTAWNITGVTPTVTSVIIGGETYNDHTDPLNADTDGDALLDGDEGPMGPFYGLPSLYNDSEPYNPESGTGSDPNPIIFNYGYTHPLDADTDDDSYLQLYNGQIDYQANQFLRDMNDGAEVAGFDIIFYDELGMPYQKLVFTNPVNPDCDGDTGITDRTPQSGMWLNSDGYELAQTPPTDPNNADSDGDGLIDGIEGVLSPESNHTNPNIADTDADGLYDMQEILLGTDPRSPDSDGDIITDGDEFYKFFTNPLVEDSDFDALKDGEEVFLWHSSPLSCDTDGDGLRDGDEVLLYGSDPVDEDSDNDGLTDREEIFIYNTNPFEYDTDSDELSDGAEILFYDTDPLNWDTDGDSITEPNEYGEMTWPMSDYQEVVLFETNATNTDSDFDGLSDGIELYFGSGEIPWMDPMPLDPLNNDTDGDLLEDGVELKLVNVSDITYPYVSVTIELTYGTNPTLADTDGDILTDYQEVVVFNSDPAVIDTDNDTLDDYHEIWVYNTSALTNDTDGDGLFDNEETVSDVYPYGPWPPGDWGTGGAGEAFILAQSPFLLADPIYETDALDWDSDDDWLPDGGEVLDYGTDPMSNDTDDDGVLDTYEFDTDLDGLPDGLEYMLNTPLLIGGGIMSPDSDGDGILDGQEYYEYGTSPTDADSDKDGFPDGYEIAAQTDPLTCPYFAVLVEMGWTEGIAQTLVTVYNYSALENVWYSYRNDTEWSSNITLSYDSGTCRWTNDSITWSQGNYELRVYGENSNGTIHIFELNFTIFWELPPGVEVPIGIPFSVIVKMQDTPIFHDVTLSVLNQTSMTEMWYRFKNNSIWSDNITLTYDSSRSQWINDSVIWENGTYQVQIFGQDYNETIHQLQLEFTIDWIAKLPEQPSQYTGSPLVIMTPANGTEVYYRTAVSVINFTNFDTIWYQYRNNSIWSDSHSLVYVESKYIWYDDTVVWSPGSYDLEVTGRMTNGTEVSALISFIVPEPDTVTVTVTVPETVTVTVPETVTVTVTVTVPGGGVGQILTYSAGAASVVGIATLIVGWFLGKKGTLGKKQEESPEVGDGGE
jgi:hypothetical protein